MIYNIDILLDLDGLIIEQAGGYWVKFEVKRITQLTAERPHGIRYSLTLHDRQGTRIMGFDNAHAVNSKNKGEYKKTYDHVHRHAKDEGKLYTFVDGQQLLKDFWIAVDKILKKFDVEEV